MFDSRTEVIRDRVFDLLYLDDYHAGDVLFIQSLARSLARWKGRRVAIIHGSGEHADRALEAEGIFRNRVQGVVAVETAMEHAIVERALRQVNRKITGVLTDAVVPAVNVIGSDRSLFVVRAGAVRVSDANWLRRLARQGIVPVVGVFAVDASSGRTGEVPMHQAIAALSTSIDAKTRVIVFTKTNLPGVMRGASPEVEVSVDSLDARVIDDIDAVSHLVSNGISVLLTNTTRLSDDNGPIGTQLRIST